MNLYPIQQQHLSLLREIEDAEGEVLPHIDLALQLTNDQFDAQAISVGYCIKAFEDEELQIEQEIDRLCELRAKATKRKELFKSRLSEAMQQFGVEKLKTPTLTLSFRKSESVQTDATLSDEWKRITTKSEPDLQRIKSAIKEGAQVPGAILITNHHLQIR